MRISRIVLLAVGLAAVALPARAAGTATAQFDVTATVLENCAVSASNLAFGNYAANSGAATTASTTLQVTCTSNLAYTIALDGGTTTSTVAARAMKDSASHQLSYGLYTSGAYSTIWGDGSGATQTVAGTGNGSAQPHTVYGRIPASQYVVAGSYSDRITVTVSY
jgi:spore coat protein U-like protein